MRPQARDPRERVVGSFEIDLDETGLEVLRLRIWHVQGQVTRFVAQYETTVNGERAPVVRYDSAHGFAHRDQLFRTRPTIKSPLPEHLTFAQALQHAELDIRTNWRAYREQF